MSPRFPVFTRPVDVECFNCGAPLTGEPKPSGYYDGRFRQECPRCGYHTFYDLAPKQKETA